MADNMVGIVEIQDGIISKLVKETNIDRMATSLL